MKWLVVLAEVGVGVNVGLGDDEELEGGEGDGVEVPFVGVETMVDEPLRA